MFLAWKEIIRNKSRFVLVALVMILISYLVYFLMGLAYGLASSYTNGIAKWGAEDIVLTNDSNDNAMMSILPDSAFEEIRAGEKARFGLLPTIAKQSETNKNDVYLLGQETGSFLWDGIGAPSLSAWGAIADSSLAKSGYAIGSSVSLVGFSKTFTIEAFVDGATYQTLPLLYVGLSSWRQLRFADATAAFSSGVAAKGPSLTVPSSLKAYSLKQYYDSLPGYGAQVATFSLMISFLVAIASFILGVFMYVLTLQKTSLFGVMKAQGVSSSYLARSVLAQTLLLIVPGCLVGFALTALSVAFLGDKLPFAYNLWFNLAILGAFIAFSLIGALFSVRTVLKIDPVKAI